MRKLLLPAALVFAASASAHAETPDWHDWYRRAISAAKSLVQPLPPDRDVIAAPRDLDRQMALVPPASDPRMPVIQPKTGAGRRAPGAVSLRTRLAEMDDYATASDFR